MGNGKETKMMFVASLGHPGALTALEHATAPDHCRRSGSQQMAYSNGVRIVCVSSIRIARRAVEAGHTIAARVGGRRHHAGLTHW